MRIFTLLSISTILLSAPSYAEPSKALRPLIRFSCPANHDSDSYKKLHYIYSLAFDQLGYNFMLLQRTAERSLMENRHNIMDGECARIHDLGDEGAGMIRIDTPVIQMEVSAWSYQTDLKINTENDLIDTPLTIGYLKGAVFFENYIARHNIKNHIAFTNQAQAIKHLASNQVSLLIMSQESIEIGLSRQQELGPPKKIVVLKKTDLFPYLSQKNAHLKKRLELELNNILREVTFPPDTQLP